MGFEVADALALLRLEDLFVDSFEVARDAICDLIIGAPPGKVYNRMRTVAKRLNARL
ncbi:RNA binding-protein [Aureococcus anophagefferens]|nr:RNA binding-protein [Aureococcus anophagefferens]